MKNYTLIIGCNGSMGTRYRAILAQMKQDFVGVDIDHSIRDIIGKAKDSSRIILCTPTDTHYSILKKIIPLKRPILCEKPIVKDIDQLNDLTNLIRKHNTHFTMMFQYSELIPYPHKKTGQSEYNYFRTGNDGLIWDCLQIISLANSDVILNNTSPVWKCKINGISLKLSDMDYAYYSFVDKWIKNKINQKLSDLILFHEKTAGFKNAKH